MISKKHEKRSLQLESVFDCWRDFFQNGRNRALEIGTVLPNLRRKVRLPKTTVIFLASGL